MTINDIRFTGYTTIANCESEPIHIPGTIQPYGVLIAVNIHTHVIDFCSANTEEYLSISVTDVLGKPLEEIIGKEESESIYRLMVNGALFDNTIYSNSKNVVSGLYS